MSIDLRVKHDLESRRRAVELFDAGVGCKPAAEALSVPRETVREWQWVYRAFGSEALLSMGGKQSRYTFEQRVAAASGVVDGGMAKTDAVAESVPEVLVVAPPRRQGSPCHAVNDLAVDSGLDRLYSVLVGIIRGVV